MKIVNPATGELIEEVQEDSAATVAKRFEAARAEQPKWAALPLSDRIQCLRKFRSLLEQDMDELAQTLTREMGKPITQARNEIKGTLGRIDYFVEAVADVMAEETVLDDNDTGITEKIQHEPLGVVGNISAWNYPYFVGGNAFFPALLTGNAVLYKPSEFATLTGKAIARLLHQSGVPEAIFSPVIGGGDAGQALLEQPLNGIFFTGSHATGVKVAAAAATKLMRIQLELGGKDPAYLCEDVDIKSTVASVADGAFYNTGQSCCSVERIYVHDRIYKEFTEAFVQEVARYKVGDPNAEDTYIGPLTRPAQLDVLETHVKQAVEGGARLLLGGKRLERKGNYFAPTVLIDVNHKMLVMREESFGPIIGIQKVGKDDEAVRLMNDTEYGLTAAVFTKDADRAKRILSQVRAGSAYWNCSDRVSPRLPWSGRGHSGIGCTLSTYGILAFLQQKAWHLKR